MISLAQLLLDAKKDLPTQLGSAALRALGGNILRQSLFSSRMVNADAVQGLRDQVTGILSKVAPPKPLVPGPGEPPNLSGSSTNTLADARLKMKQLGQALKHDPAAGGFPGQQFKSTIAEPGSLKDLFSTDRLNLMLNTNQQMVQGAARNIWANTPQAVDEYPAFELVRVAARETPRGLIKRGKGVVEVPEDAWDTATGRWQAACTEAGDDEALDIFKRTGRMVARKDSGVWQALGDGAGGYDDGLGNDYEPFAFNSGMGRVELSRKEFIELGGDPDAEVEPRDTEFGASQVKLNPARLDPDLLEQFIKAMKSGDIRYRVKVSVGPTN